MRLISSHPKRGTLEAAHMSIQLPIAVVVELVDTYV